MSVVNYYKKIKKTVSHNPNKNIHGLEFPSYFCIIGGSGSGKTNVLTDFLFKTANTFNRIVICCKNKDEPLYNFLEKKAPEIEFYENGEIPDIDSFDKNMSNLIVFDDLLLKKDQSDISEYFIRSRKLNTTCIYLSQSYYKIPKIIRINLRYIIIKKLSSVKDLKLILSEYSLDSNLDKLLSLYTEATRDFTDFLLIDTQNNIITKNYPI